MHHREQLVFFCMLITLAHVRITAIITANPHPGGRGKAQQTRSSSPLGITLVTGGAMGNLPLQSHTSSPLKTGPMQRMLLQVPKPTALVKSQRCIQGMRSTSGCHTCNNLYRYRYRHELNLSCGLPVLNLLQACKKQHCLMIVEITH